MSKTTSVVAATVLAASATLSLSVPVRADDQKILPGSICQPTSTGISAERSFYSGASVVNFTNASNGTFQDVRLHCPLVRDNTYNKWNFLYVRVTDSSNTASVRCTGTSYGYYGQRAYSVTASSGTSFTGNKSLTLPAPTNVNLNGAFHVYCILPTNTGTPSAFTAIHSIRYSEDVE